MIEHSIVRSYLSHTPEGTRTVGSAWRTTVSVLNADTIRVVVSVFVLFLAMPAFAEDSGRPSALMVICAIAMLSPTIWFMFRGYRHCHFGIMAVTNDNSEAIARFTEALEHADCELVIHDDGDKVEGSVYDDDLIVQAIRDRLRKFPKLRIRCLLNFKANVKVTELSKEFGDRFQVRYLLQRPVDDVHFKIADQGKWAYLSTHIQGDTRRDGEVCDGTRASKRVRRYYVGDLLEAFDVGFKKAYP